MSTDKQYTLDMGFAIIRKCLAREQKNIFNQLEKMFNPDTVKLKEPRKTYKRHGIKTKKNDYRDYYWIKVVTKFSTYWITLFYNDVDKTTGNFHTQIGRIQFWKDIKPAANGIVSPNRKDSADNWYLCSENAEDPKMRINDKNYNVEKHAMISLLNCPFRSSDRSKKSWHVTRSKPLQEYFICQH